MKVTVWYQGIYSLFEFAEYFATLPLQLIRSSFKWDCAEKALLGRIANFIVPIATSTDSMSSCGLEILIVTETPSEILYIGNKVGITPMDAYFQLL